MQARSRTARAAPPVASSDAAAPSTRRPRLALVRPLLAPDGGRAELLGDAIAVFDASNRLLIRYRDGYLEVAPPEGDLVLASATGQVRIEAATDLVLAAARDVTVEGSRSVEARAGGSCLSVGATKTVLATGALDVRAKATRVTTGEVNVVARTILTNATKMASTAEDVELTAGRIAVRTRDVLQEIAGTLQARIGRVRARVLDTYSLRTRRTELQSTEDTAIDGRRVLLG